jgi:membrane-associated protein
MEIFNQLIEFILHFDKHLDYIISQYGALTYLFLFGIIFAETGFVFTPFLPGDSMIFAAGTFAAKELFNVHLLFIMFSVAAILGDTLNYWIGHYIGPKVFEKDIKFLKKEYLDRTHQFYEKHGGKTIILARFIPIVRTFAPFVAGVGSMSYKKFISYNVIGGIIWCALFVYSGYYFGNLSFVKNNFSVVLIAIVAISVLPAFYEFFKHKFKKNIK